MTRQTLQQSTTTIEGIGEKSGDALAAKNIRTLLDLLIAGPAGIRRALPRLSREHASQWHAAAKLLLVDDMTKDLAEAFVADGILSIPELAEAGLQRLERAVAVAHEQRKIADAPSLYRIAAIQRRAGELGDKSLLSGRIFDKTSGGPIPGVEVRADGKRDVTDEVGCFILGHVTAGELVVGVEGRGYLPASARIVTRSDDYSATVCFRLAPGRPRPAAAPVDERAGGLIFASQMRFPRLVQRPLAELPDDSFLLVRRVMKSGAVRLVNLHRRLVDRTVVVDLVDVPKSALPSETRSQEVLRFGAGRLEHSGKTLREIARTRFEAAVGAQSLESEGRRIRLHASTPGSEGEQ